MQRPEFAIGISGTLCESAKELHYPSTSARLRNSEEDKARYKRSHGVGRPGEQKNRNYSKARPSRASLRRETTAKK
ncbi:hypothetical protein DVH05_014860 [Phytophthora capsici]|nr:hypothetical protein DVH05_014860 [Phytophthora capsici]